VWPFTRASKPRKRPDPPFGGAAVSWVDGPSWASALGGMPTSIAPQQAEMLSAVVCAVELIAGSIANLPAEVLQTDAARTPAPQHPLQRLIDRGPNENESFSDLMATWIASALLRGNGLLELKTDNAGRLAGLATIPWQFVTPWLDENGALYFDFIPTQPPGAGQRRRLLRQDVILLKDRSDTGVLGVPRITRAANSLQHALEMQTASYQFSANMARPAGTLNAPGKVSEAVMTRLSQDWDNNYSAGKRGKTAVLPEGLTFTKLGLFSAEDVQLIDRLKYSVEDISRIFQVPPTFLGDSQRSTFASAKEATSTLARHTLLPWIAKIERAFAQSVLSSSYQLSIDVNSLLKSDFDTFSTALGKYRAGGILTANECRAELGYPSRADGDSIVPPAVTSPASPAADTPPPSKGKPNGHAHA
jgi:HK97 family phage portal protein